MTTINIIDPHIHMFSRTTDDYEAMAKNNIVAVVEPAFWLGSDKRFAGSFFDYFKHMITFEPERAKKYGIKHFCVVGVNPKEANDTELANKVLDEINEYVKRDNVVGIGEIGFDQITEEEEDILKRQLEIAEENALPVIIHSPHTNKPRGVEKICEIIEDMGLTQDRILLDHNTEDTIGITKSLNVWAGHTIYPETKLTPKRAVDILKKHGIEKMIINSSADWGPSDPLSVPKTVELMKKDGFKVADIQTVVYDNPNKFFSQSEQWNL